MKKIILSGICLFIICVAKLSAQAAGDKKGWPSAERTAFISECVKTAKANMSEDSARSYCYCMQEKVEKKYPTIEEASKITAADMQSEVWQKEIRNCMTSNSQWTSVDRSGFVTECVNAAKGNMTEQKAKSYCECMLFKVEKKYPNPTDAGEITDETMKSPEWKKMIKDCFEF